MNALLQGIYGGMLYGSVYGLMALGLTLIWGSLGVLNLAHGALYLAGGYLSWLLIHQAHLPLLVAFGLAVIGAALLGLVLHTALIGPILSAPGRDSASLIATLGASIVIESAVLLLFGPQAKQVPPILAGGLTVGTVLIEHQKLLVIGIAVAALFAVNLFLRTSRHGMAIRAVSQDMDAAKLVGIPIRTTFLLTMGVSSALAGLAGVLLSSIFFLYPSAGFQPMLSALIVTVFGGLGSVKGTIWAAYTIGLLEALLQVYAGPSWAIRGLFVFMIVMLVIRPNGLFGGEEARRL